MSQTSIKIVPVTELSAHSRFSQRGAREGVRCTETGDSVDLGSSCQVLAVDRSLKWSDRFQHRSCDCRPVCSGVNLRDEETGSQDLTKHRQGRDEKFERQVDFG
jgi:hypothetical protein